MAVLLDVMSIGIYIPAAEKLVDRYSITPTMVGLGLSIYSLFAFFSTPILGQLSDKYGRKWLLIACIAGTALSYLMLLGNHLFWLFILSRIVNGVTGGNFSILQAIIADISKNPAERTKNLGLMGGIFGLGFIVGPIFGSLALGRGTIEVVFLMGAALAVLDLVAMVLRLPETHTEQSGDLRIDFSVFRTIRKYFSHDKMSKYLRSLLIIMTATFTYQGVLSIETKLHYGVGGEYFGYIMAASGVITGLNLALLLPKFWMKRFSPHMLIRIGHIGMIVILAGLTINGVLANSSFVAFLLLFISMSFFGTLFGPVYQNEVISHSEKNKTGELTGVMASIQTIAMAVGPVVGGFLLTMHLPLYCVALIGVIVSFLIMRREA